MSRFRASGLVFLAACSVPVYIPNEPPPPPTADTGTPAGTATGLTGGTPTGTVNGLPCSVESVAQAQLIALNSTTETLDLFWLDFGCNEVFLRTVDPTQSTFESSFATHTFGFRDPSGALRAWLTLDESTGQVMEAL